MKNIILLSFCLILSSAHFVQADEQSWLSKTFTTALSKCDIRKWFMTIPQDTNFVDQSLQKTIHLSPKIRIYDRANEYVWVTLTTGTDKDGLTDATGQPAPSKMHLPNNPDIVRIESTAEEKVYTTRDHKHFAIEPEVVATLQFLHNRCTQLPQDSSDEVAFDCNGKIHTLFAEIRKNI